jgi:hypothetical protein
MDIIGEPFEENVSATLPGLRRVGYQGFDKGKMRMRVHL